MPKLSDLTEDAIVERIAKLVAKPTIGEHLYYPEDARDVIPRGPRIIYSMDAYTVKSLKLPWRDYSDVGWTAMVGAFSDVIAKGGVPGACMIALGLPRDMNLDELDLLIRGFEEASIAYNVRVLGGDTNESAEAWIAVSVLGFTTARIPPSRRGLRTGDVVIVTGTYGAMGYVAKHGIEQARKISWVVKNTKRPRVYSEVALVIESCYKAISATMDVSDGLGYTLEILSNLSKAGIIIRHLPHVYEEVFEICGNNVHCSLEYALNGGEEYGVVMGVKKEWLRRITKELDYFNIPYSIIGEATDLPPGVYFNGIKLETLRYDQFHGWR